MIYSVQRFNIVFNKQHGRNTQEEEGSSGNKNVLEETTLVTEHTDETQREAICHHEDEWICKAKEESDDAEHFS